MAEIEDSQAQRRKYELKVYKNTPQNERHVEEAVEAGFEVYERNRKFIRLRREKSEESDAAETSADEE